MITESKEEVNTESAVASVPPQLTLKPLTQLQAAPVAVKNVLLSQRRQYTYYVYKGNFPQHIEAALEKRGVWRKMERGLQRHASVSKGFGRLTNN